MKKNLFGFITVSVLLATAAASTATTFFTDNFNAGSTVNQAPGSPTIFSTSYQTVAGSATITNVISANDLFYSFPASSSLLGEVLGLFTNSPIALSLPGDYLAITIVFTNTANILGGLDTANSTLNIGLFNSGGVPPNQGPIVSPVNTNNANTGGTQNWVGYVGRMFFSGTANIFTRPAQAANPATAQCQDLLFSGASSTQAFNNPNGTSLGGTGISVHLTNGMPYTLQLGILFNTPGSLQITNAIFGGTSATGTPIFTQTQTATNTTILAGSFDGFAFGWRNTGGSQVSALDISSITVSGSVTPPCCLPIIDGPAPVVVATNGSCAFSVFTLFVIGETYQWHRNGTNLLDGGNISGATSAQLIISPAGTNDVCSGTNGYYVTVTGAGGFTFNSTNTSLVLCPAANLVWSGPGNVWDVATSSNWLDGGVSAAFNYGDSVIFDDSADFNNLVNVSGNYVSASSVTVSNDSLYYKFQGSGSISGPGKLLYNGGAPLELNCVNSFSGGTIISNATAYLKVDLYGALGTGPLTFARAGGLMEIVTNGNIFTGIKGDVIVADDFTIQFDGSGAFAGVFLGNLSGTTGKTLTLTPQNLSANSRYRVYGINTVFNANLVLDGNATSQAIYSGTVLALYESSGSQTYNGIISGNGGLVQRDSGTTILNGPNTYAGGTTPTTGVIAFGTDTVGAVVAGPIGTGPLFLSPEIPNLTGSGTVMAWNGARTIANPIQYPSATNNLTLIIGGTNALTFTGPISLNGNDFNGTFTNRIFQITNTALTAFSGVISDGGIGFGLTKTGNGVLALNNTETYTGPTTVSNGTLQVNGQLAGTVNVNGTNGTLAGTGTIRGAVTITVGSTLAPGTSSAIGSLAISNNLTLNGSLFFKLTKLVSPSNDVVTVSGSLANGGTGTLTVTNLGPALAVGDRFQLFDHALTGGGSLTVTGGGPSVIWINHLATDGSIIVQGICGPTILSQPVSRAIAPGASATLSVTASTLTMQTNYQWFHGTTNLGGQTNETLAVNHLQPADLGSYTVLVDDGTCSTLSNPAILTAAVSPAFFNLSVSGTTFIMYFPTEFGPSYVIETKQNLIDPGWTPVTTYLGDGSPKVFTTPTQSYPQSFFRIRLE